MPSYILQAYITPVHMQSSSSHAHRLYPGSTVSCSPGLAGAASGSASQVHHFSDSGTGSLNTLLLQLTAPKDSVFTRDKEEVLCKWHIKRCKHAIDILVVRVCSIMYFIRSPETRFTCASRFRNKNTGCQPMATY